jgi:uncharacterized protein DUF4252
MKPFVIALILALIPATGAHAQDFKMPVNLDKLASKASETTEVTLNGRMLQLAAKFMNDEDDVEAREMVKKLKGIYVRSFQFDSTGAYSDSDVEAVRSQLKSPMWEKIVNVRSKRDGENAEIYFKGDNPDRIDGIVIIAANPKELTIVHIDGPLDPSDIEKLGGDFGVPRVEVRPKAKPAKAGAR